MLRFLLFSFVAYSVDRVSLHWIENLLSHQQKTGESLVSVYRNLRKRQILYAGFWGKSLSIAPARVLTLSGYHESLGYFINKDLSLLWSATIAGTVAGLIDAIGTCPGENARTRSAFNLPKSMKIQDNFRGFFALLARSIGAPIILTGSTLILYYQLLPSYLNNGWCAGFIIGAISQVITSPCDVVKNDLMSNPDKRYTQAIRDMIREKNGYRGIVAKTIRMSLGSAIVIGVIECLNGLY